MLGLVQRQRPRRAARAFVFVRARRLLAGGTELGRNRREGRDQLLAERVDDTNDRNGNAGRDQTIFDGGRSALVAQETLDVHDALPSLSAYRRREVRTYDR